MTDWNDLIMPGAVSDREGICQAVRDGRIKLADQAKAEKKSFNAVVLGKTLFADARKEACRKAFPIGFY